MNNAEDILKKILLNMRYDPKKTIKEQSSISNNTKKSDPGNYSLEGRKFISCVDGSEYVSPNITIYEKHEPYTSQKWMDWNNRLLSENKPNALTACKYQSTIKVQQKRTTLSYDDEVINCINFSYQSFNNKPMFCAKHFSLLVLEDGSDNIKENDFKDVWLTSEDWFTSEYKKYTEDNSYQTKEPFETLFYVKSYNEWNGKKYTPFVMTSIIDGEKGVNIEKIATGNLFAEEKFLPLTNAEKGQFNDISLTKNDKFKNSGKYICKNSDKPMVNLRTSNEVNTDTGFFDPSDNYINWSGDEIIGEYLGEKWSYIEWGTGSLMGGTTLNEKLEKWKKSLTDSDIQEIYKSLGGNVPEGKMQSARSNLSSILNGTNDDEIQGLSVIPKKYQDSIVKFNVSHKWYHVKFSKPYKDQTDDNTYDNGWVRSDNVDFCLPTTDKNAQTNYRLEYIKRLPIKPFKDPIESQKFKKTTVDKALNGRIYKDMGSF